MDLNWVKHIFLMCLCVVTLSENCYAQDVKLDKHIEVSLRMIGHQVLLNSGDSTSRVLPISQDGDTYRIQFESEFDFLPEELVGTTYNVVKETKIAESYIVEVEDCFTKEIVHSYEEGKTDSTDVMACRTRAQPQGCYNLLFTILERGEGINGLDKEEAVIAGPTRSTFLLIPLLLMFGLYLYFRKKKDVQSTNPEWIQIGEYVFDKRNMKLSIADNDIELTSKEADLLYLLRTSANHTLERDVILNKVWGDEGDYIGRTLDVFISKLRKKLVADPNIKITNIRGVGYKMVLNDAE